MDVPENISNANDILTWYSLGKSEDSEFAEYSPSYIGGTYVCFGAPMRPIFDDDDEEYHYDDDDEEFHVSNVYYRKCAYCNSIIKRIVKCPYCGAPEE